MTAVAVVDIQVNGQQAVNQLRNINNAANQTQQGINGLTGTIRKLAAGFSAIQAARFVFAKTAEIESQTKSLEVLTGSVTQAKRIIQELQQLGAVTPFTSTELIDAAKRLQAFGVEAKDVVETTRRLADVSGATGAELQGLVTAFGQVQAKGRLQGEELLQFQERGIGLQKELQSMYGMTGEEFRKSLEKGRFSAEAVQVAIENLTNAGGKYANGAVAQSTTLQGKFSTLQDGVDALAREIGNTLAPSLKIALDDLTNFVNGFVQGLQYMQNQYRTFLANLRGKTADELQGQIGKTNDLIAANQRQLSKVDPASRIGLILDQKIVALRNLRNSLQKDLDQKLGLVAPQGRSATLPAAQPRGAKPPALLGETGGAGRTKKAKKGPESQLSAIEAANGLYRSQQMIVERIAIAEFEGNRAEVLRLQHIERGVQLMHDAAAVQRDQTVPLMDREAQLRGISDKLMGSSSQYARELAQYMREQVESLPGYLDKLVSMASGYSSVLDFSKRLTEEQQRQKELADGIGNSVGQGMVGAFDALILGADNFNSALQNIASGVLTDIAKQLLQVFVIQQAINAISGILAPKTGGLAPGVKFMPSAFSMPNLMARAGGGSVMAGQGYLVGERGPELFMPGRSGGIAPAGSFGGGTNITVNVDAKGSSVQGNAGRGDQLARAVAMAVQAELIKQKRPGGILA